ncbi:MAG: DUF488 family protein [Gemmatimonadetes bacterium]|nr:DUF488 family protein [Gemmatimonadota bacterium]
MDSPATVYTLGHSTRSLDELVALLRQFGVALLVDVRRFPASRRHPHFGRDVLVDALRSAGIRYRHEPGLGGRRSPRPDSPNTAWRSRAFRGYADHMDSAEFATALDTLTSEVRSASTAIMCAEVTPWRCHRQIIADALVARGLRVIHVISPSRTEVHRLNPNARVLPDGRVIYPGPPEEQPELWGEGG